MTNPPNRFARFPGASLEHTLREGTLTTICGRDATTANRYPFLTRANSKDRRLNRPCPKCAR